MRGGIIAASRRWEANGGVVDESPVPFAYYPLNTNSNDIIGGRNGVDTSMAYVAGGQVGNCADFALDTAKIEVAGDDFVFADATKDLPFSISFWVNFGGSRDLWLVHTRLTEEGSFFQIYYYLEKLEFALYQSLSIYRTLSHPLTLTTNKWVNMQFTHSQGEMKLYINGTDVNAGVSDTGSYTKMDNTDITPLRFGYPWGSDGSLSLNGNIFSGGNLSLSGKLDEIAFFNKALSAEEVTQVYNKGLNGLPLI